MLASSWKSLSEAKKKESVHLYEQDKIRYQKECNELKEKGFFIDSNGVKSSDLMLSNPKFLSGVVKPKKSNTAYIFYVKEQYTLIKAKMPNLDAPEILNILSKSWKELS